MAQFERLMAPSEQEAAGRLKSYIADVQDNPQQVVKHTTSTLVLKYCVWVCAAVLTYRMWLCLCVFAAVVAVTGISKAQGIDQTSHH